MSAPSAAAEAARCGILLHPAGHTLSPTLHAAAYGELGLDARYEVFDVPPAVLHTTLARLRSEGVRQLSVSLPHKESVIALCDHVSESVQHIGAANTLTRIGGNLHAENTDWLGVVRSLEAHGSWRDARATVIGAGGAARGVVYALRQLGCTVTLVNRTRARAERIAQQLGARLGTLDEPYDILVNTTSLGMQPHTEGSPVPFERLRSEALVFDIVYAPLETRLLREARVRGCRTQDGLDMLVHQAVEQVQLWSGRRPSPSTLRAAAERALAARES